MDDFDLNEVGYVLDELDFDDLPPLRSDRPRWQPSEWWSRTDYENYHLDYPDFQSAADRAHYMIGEMGRTALALLDGATADDEVFPHGDKLVSLNQLLRTIHRDSLDELLNKL